MTATRTAARRRRPEDVASRRAGYLVVALVNLAILWIAHQLLEWAWPGFLTDAFEDLLPWITVSCVAAAVVNVLWVVWDPEWFKHLGQMALNAISFAVAVRTWQIFPFDFADYPAWWETATRVLIVIGIVGSAIATVVEAVQLARSGLHALPEATSDHPRHPHPA